MANGKSWSKHRAERQKENWAKAHKRHEEHVKAGHHGVRPSAFNGHSIGGYSIKKHGTERAAELAGLHTRPNKTRRVARRALSRNRAKVGAA